ncbi:MAG: hypothetical protein QOG16_1247 [Actinomycetota bacterium]|jgi:hypothetical protein|nr:hypothetical protein [Actinomycetota bacterium]
MTNLHTYVAFSIPAGFAVLMLTSIYSYVRNKEAPGFYWTLLGALQAILGVQFLIGVYLFLSGARPQSNGPSWLHYVYGAGFPLFVLVIAHTQARKRPGIEIMIFGIAAFLCTFSALRALQTGLGID